MAFPKTSDDLKAMGYVFIDDAECKGCGEAIEWYRTPKGKSIPINPMGCGSDKAIPHWTTCTEADFFHKKKI